MTKFLMALAAALMLMPLAQAHASPDPLDNESQLLADDSDDAYAYHDGFDLQDLYVRGFYDREDDAHGLAFRMILYGGPTPVPVTQQHHLDLYVDAAGTTHSFRVSSADGVSWTGDMKQLEGALEPSDDGLVGLAGSLQLFIPFEALGVQPGDSVGPFRWETYADDDLRDLAPGGRPVPGTGGAVILPGESTAVLDSYMLAGPVGYTESILTGTDGVYNVQVKNLITVIGQHIFVTVDDVPGWTIERTNLNAQNVDAGVHPEFQFTAVGEPGSDPLRVVITSDLGGFEQLFIAPGADTGTGEQPSPSPGGESPLGGSKESPGVGWVAGLLLAGLAAILRRK